MNIFIHAIQYKIQQHIYTCQCIVQILEYEFRNLNYQIGAVHIEDILFHFFSTCELCIKIRRRSGTICEFEQPRKNRDISIHIFLGEKTGKSGKEKKMRENQIKKNRKFRSKSYSIRTALNELHVSDYSFSIYIAWYIVIRGPALPPLPSMTVYITHLWSGFPSSVTRQSRWGPALATSVSLTQPYASSANRETMPKLRAFIQYRITVGTESSNPNGATRLAVIRSKLFAAAGYEYTLYVVCRMWFHDLPK